MPKIKETSKKPVKTTKPRKATKTTKVAKMVKVEKAVKVKKIKYWSAIGRRKAASAQVRLFTRGEREFSVNNKDLKKYFVVSFLQDVAKSPLGLLNIADKFGVQVKVIGGGINAQAEAIRHGISRALVEFNPNFRKKLKKAGYLTRDPRKKERKKFGLKKARRAPQWQKR